MLEKTKAKLDSMYAGGGHLGTDGKIHVLDGVSKISFSQGEKIAEIHRALQPALSVEIGMAYGFSTLFILDAMHEGGYGRHIAIDPGEDSDIWWHGIGLAGVRDAGLAERFCWINKCSADGLSDLASAKQRVQFVYIDGDHHFDYALIDFCLSDRILDVGGIVLMDDMWMPSIKKAAAFVSENMKWYERLEIHYDNLACFKKTAGDARAWDHFADF